MSGIQLLGSGSTLMDVEDFLRELRNKMTAVWNGAPV